MKTIPPPFEIFSVVFAILMLVAFAACSDDDSAPATMEAVSISNIAGVTPPAFTEAPVRTITPSAQYTGSVSWSPEVTNTFTSNTVYTATITLTPEPGYSFTGVAEDFFAVAGATNVSSSAGSNVITAIFPATLATVPVAVTITGIEGVPAPVHGAAPVTTISSNTQYTGIVSWSPGHNPFYGGQQYTATISLTPQPGFTFTGVAEDFFTVAGATEVTSSADSAVITAVFPPLPLMPITLSNIPGIPEPVHGAAPVATITANTQYTGIVSWQPDYATFIAGTNYTATIRLTPQPGYTFTGVAEDFFTVAGATEVTSSADSAVITAVFPPLPLMPITLSNIIMGIPYVEHSVIPPATITSNTQYTGTVSWSPAHPTFIAGTNYTATITLTPQPGYSFTGVAEDFFTVVFVHEEGRSVHTSYSAGSTTVTARYGKASFRQFTLSNIQGVTPPVSGATPVRTITPTVEYSGTVVWEPDHTAFMAGTNYTATITLISNYGFTAGTRGYPAVPYLPSDFFRVDGATNVTFIHHNRVVAIFPPAR